jgi:hypothetical protein
MFRLMALVALLVVADAAAAESRLVPYTFHGALQAADMASTRGALARGGRESNPIAHEPVKILAAALMAEGDHVLDKRGNQKAKWTARIIVGLAYGWMVHHNHEVHRRR